MTMEPSNARDGNGDWRPAGRIKLPPIYAWPPLPSAVGKWMFGFPGYLWPMNSLTLGITLVVWFFLTPELAAMKTFEAWWLAWLLARNLALTLTYFGGLHLYLYVFKKQGDHLKFTSKPFATNDRRFLFANQVQDNMFRTLCAAVPIFTAYEAVTYWLFANALIGFIPIAEGSFLYWSWFVALLLFAPVIHSVHFYFIHRLLHWRPLYRTVHRIHHYNVNVGPWSGLAMHPVELAIYFSTVCVQWLIALHPVNAIFQTHLAVFNAAVSHTGFDKLLVGGRFAVESNNHFHYLHHKHFECNYGSTIAPMDQLLGTFHDGTPEAQSTMHARMLERRVTDA
ncbi:MAG: sterol desaturase family protein [Hyphomicrobiaceae bacterium]